MNKEETLKSVFKEVLQIDMDNTDENQKFIDMEIWDSMTFMFFITSIEDKFKITLTNEEILDIDCIKSAKEIIFPKID